MSTAVALSITLTEDASAASTVPSPKHEIEALYEAPSVPARVDRVWKLIPGLNGWKLDKTRSNALTARLHDGRDHYVWVSVPPKPGLRDLGAEPIYRGPDVEPAVSLMINVSWGEAYVPGMLDTLRKEHVHATFFLDGDWVVKHGDLVRDMVHDGHAIGSHGTGHPDFQRLSASQTERQIRRTNAIIREVSLRTPVAFAPPSGSFNRTTVSVAHRQGMPTILWTVDTIDWQKPPASVIVRRVQKQVTPGALVLMHPTQSTATALPTLIEWLKAKGYRFKTIADVIHERRTIVPPETMPNRSS